MLQDLLLVPGRDIYKGNNPINRTSMNELILIHSIATGSYVKFGGLWLGWQEK